MYLLYSSVLLLIAILPFSLVRWSNTYRHDRLIISLPNRTHTYTSTYLNRNIAMINIIKLIIKTTVIITLICVFVRAKKISYQVKIAFRGFTWCIFDCIIFVGHIKCGNSISWWRDVIISEIHLSEETTFERRIHWWDCCGDGGGNDEHG